MTEGRIFDGPPTADATLVFAHGAGAGMDSPFMSHIAVGLGAMGTRVIRFEFPYMQRRRAEGGKRPPDRMPVLLEAFADTVEDVRKTSKSGTIMIGGKSMGGRVASMIADELKVPAVICLGYPFHPAGRPARLRTEHLEQLSTPTLIVQGTRDPLGSRGEVDSLQLSTAIQIFWIEDGDHDLTPRRASGRTAVQNLNTALDRIASFIREFASPA